MWEGATHSGMEGSYRGASAHRQVAGRPLQLFDALAQGALNKHTPHRCTYGNAQQHPDATVTTRLQQTLTRQHE